MNANPEKRDPSQPKSDEWVAGYQAGKNTSVAEGTRLQALLQQLNGWILTHHATEEVSASVETATEEVAHIIAQFSHPRIGSGVEDTIGFDMVEDVDTEIPDAVSVDRDVADVRIESVDRLHQAAATLLAVSDEYTLLMSRLRALQQLVEAGSVSSREIGDALTRMTTEFGVAPEPEWVSGDPTTTKRRRSSKTRRGTRLSRTSSVNQLHPAAAPTA